MGSCAIRLYCRGYVRIVGIIPEVVIKTNDLTAAARIRNAALELFADKGTEATSVREIAARAGVSPGLVQHHFTTKIELRAAVNDHVVSIASDFFADMPTKGAPKDVQQEMGDRVTAFVRDHPTALRYVARAAADGDESALATFDAFVDIARSIYQRLEDAGLTNPEADLTWAALHVVALNLGTVLLSEAISRHLPDSFFDAEQLERWNAATNTLFEQGVLRRQRGESPPG